MTARLRRWGASVPGARGVGALVVACCVAGLSLFAAGAEPTVEQWGVYEVALEGPATGNPFLERCTRS